MAMSGPKRLHRHRRRKSVITLTLPALTLIIGLAMAAGRVGVAPIASATARTAKLVTHPMRHPKKDAKAVAHFMKGGH
jgi:hypothetical protein